MRRLAAVALAALLSACATAPPRPPGAAQALWEARQTRLAALDDWGFAGRVAVTADNKGWNANLRWQQQDAHYDIRVLAPLGQTVAWLTGDAQGVELRTAGHGLTQAAEPEILLRSELGWSVPVSGLRYWVLGLPDRGRPATNTELDGEGRLSRLSQDGWDIRFLRYKRIDALDLPDKITLANSRLDVRLVVDSWQVP